MSAQTCDIRIWLPLNENLLPKTDGKGHFDLVINKSQFTVTGRNGTPKTYSYPVLSYAGVWENNICKGTLTIYNEASNPLTAHSMFAKSRVETDDNGINNIISWINSHCDLVETEDTAQAVYRVNTGDSSTDEDFSQYSMPEKNCFAMTALFCKLAGNDYLWSIYRGFSYPNGHNDADGYKRYYAWAMFKTYHRAWRLTELRGE